MKKRLSLLSRGLFPETLPPCFDSKDAERAFRGIIGDLDAKKFQKRETDYIRYNGTKHDRNRRSFGTPNIVSYFHVSSFIKNNWVDFRDRFNLSKFSISSPSIMEDDGDRCIKVPSLSELSKRCSTNLKYAPVILKADISQYFSSIYTHSIPWSKHGKQASKADFDKKSANIYFNELDFHIRNCQSAQTRGILIGPDAFRLVAEFISCGIDDELMKSAGASIVGAVRHVDDFYIGLKSEADALVVLSKLRDILADHELQLNDNKTRVFPSVEPINDLWAQRIRNEISGLHSYNLDHQKFTILIDNAFEQAKFLNSDSPVKMALRGLDTLKIYKTAHWELIEGYLQRSVHYFPHAIDYVCLLVVKRFAVTGKIDKESWKDLSENIIKSNTPYRNHHEILWIIWMMLSCDLSISEDICDSLININNSHINALLVQAFSEGKISKKPSVRFSTKLQTTDANWLTNIIGRTTNTVKSSFGGLMSDEFEHLSNRNVKLIDIKSSVDKLKEKNSRAISRSRYGYDDNDDDDGMVIPFIDED